MNPLSLGCIVEGPGDARAVPVLVARIAGQLRPDLALRVPAPVLLPRTRLRREGELERAMELAARKVRPPAGILVVMDADDDPPCVLGPEVLARARKARGDLPVGVVLANREYEAWLLAALPSLAGRGGLPADPDPIARPEAVRGAKEYLDALLRPGGTYRQTVDQEKFTRWMDLREARRAPSFDKCWREVEALLREATRRGG